MMKIKEVELEKKKERLRWLKTSMEVEEFTPQEAKSSKISEEESHLDMCEVNQTYVHFC